MENIVIVGAGGFGREVRWLISRINDVQMQFNIIGFVDDGFEAGTMIDELPVLGGSDFLTNYQKEISVVIAIGSAKTRKSVAEKLMQNKNLVFPNLSDPSVVSSEKTIFGKGNIICAGTILTVDYEMKDFNIINLDCTIGHDVVLDSFVTIYPGVNVSGCVSIGNSSEIGTGTSIIQGITIGRESIIGAGSVVVKDIDGCGVYVGIPSKKLK